jgi:hypothetical protein
MEAALGAAIHAETDTFVSDTVLLVGKGEADKGGGAEILVGAGVNIEKSITHESLDVVGVGFLQESGFELTMYE